MRDYIGAALLIVPGIVGFVVFLYLMRLVSMIPKY